MIPSSDQRTRLLVTWLIVGSLVLVGYSILNSYLLFTIQRYFETGYYIHGLKRVILFIVGATALAILFIASNRPVLVVAVLVVFVNGTVNFAFRGIAKDVLTTEKIGWLLSEVHQVGNASIEFAPQILSSGVRVALALFTLLIARHLARKPIYEVPNIRVRRTVGSLAFVPYVILGLILRVFDPDPVPWEYNLSIGTLNELVQDIPTPRPPDMQPVDAGIEKILLVIDESVRADTFRTLFGAQLKVLGGIEFRDAWTAVPCSGGANAFLRWGINPTGTSTIDTDPRTQPTIFGYATVAGYDTFLFDAQTNGGLQNFLSVPERALIKHFSAKEQGINSDSITAKSINEVMRQPGRQLIYFIKRGAHFPYERNLPAGTYDGRASKVQLYASAVEYSDKPFFQEILRGIDRDRLLMIYTSDHGQRLTNEGLPHCNPKPQKEELLVPLWLFPPQALRTRLQEVAAQSGTATFSGLQIMPTLLLAMGFAEGQIDAKYYRTLLAGPSQRWLLRSPYLPYPAPKAGPVKFTEFKE